MKLSRALLFLSIIIMASHAAPAQVPDGGIMLNRETGTTFLKNGKCTVTEVAVSDQDFTSAIKVEVGSDVINSWDAQVKFPPWGSLSK